MLRAAPDSLQILVSGFIDFSSNVARHPSVNNVHTQAARLSNNALDNSLQRLPAQSHLRVLDLRDLVHVLQADLANRTSSSHAGRGAVVEGSLAFAISSCFAVRASNISGAADFVLRRFHTGGGKEELCSGRRADLEVEAAIGTDGDTRGYGCAGDVVCCAGIELL